MVPKYQMKVALKYCWFNRFCAGYPVHSAVFFSTLLFIIICPPSSTTNKELRIRVLCFNAVCQSSAESTLLLYSSYDIFSAGFWALLLNWTTAADYNNATLIHISFSTFACLPVFVLGQHFHPSHSVLLCLETITYWDGAGFSVETNKFEQTPSKLQSNTLN